MSANYTIATIAWRKQRRNHRLLFGHPDKTIRLGWHNSLMAFSPHQVFGYERWRANKYGTIEWQIFILKSGAKGDQVDLITGINPGAHLLLSAHGKPASKKLLSVLDAIAKHKKLTELSSPDWLTIRGLLSAGIDPENLLKHGVLL